MGKFESFFIAIASQLDLTETEEKMIINSYESVGSYLSGSDYLSKYDIHVFPQGSMRIGTTVKPLKKDDYDIDLVCEFTKSFYYLSAKDVKQLVGNTLKSGKYLEQLEEEHSRCWTLQYNANPPYHIDILPGVSIVNKRIKATIKKKSGVYDWLYTNPVGFADWFLGLYKKKQVFDEKSGVEKVKTYDRRSPLQRAVQLVKRHRDVYFQNRNEDGPASIIITALSGLSYNNESSIEDILRNGPISWVSHIEKNNGKYIIKIPGLPDDNYADKWNGEDKNAPVLFFEWHSKLISDLDKLFAQNSLNSFVKVSKSMFGESSIDRVLKENISIYDSLNESFHRNAVMVLEDKHPLFNHAISISHDSHRYVPKDNVRITIKGKVFADEEYRNDDRDEKCLFKFDSYSPLLNKHLYLRFSASFINKPQSCYLRWQITNTGDEAIKEGKDSLRGGFEFSEKGHSWTKFEYTSYAGTHFVQAFVIDRDTGNCVAKSNILTINIGADN